MNMSFMTAFLFLIFLMIPVSMSSRPAINQLTKLYHHSGNERAKDNDKSAIHAIRRAFMIQSAGSGLPDCSHACGSCMPCRLVIVGSVCASLTEAESCPISYRCMCNYKTYPVP